jgi:hypothetical protein
VQQATSAIRAGGPGGSDYGAQIRSTAAIAVPQLAIIIAMAIEQPNARPTLRCRPERVNGMPSCRDSRALAPDIPNARFQENETPGIRTLLRAMADDQPSAVVACPWQPEAKS